MYVCLSSVWL